MAAYLTAQIVLGVLSVLFVLFLIFGYRRRPQHQARLRTFQYRLYAVRDKVIRLVADGTFSENDEQWRHLYSSVNNMAHAAIVDRLRGGLSFVLVVLALPSPTEEEIAGFESLSPELRSLWGEYAKTILSICHDGSWPLRWALRCAIKVKKAKEVIQRNWPRESTAYSRWQRASRAAHA